MMLPFLTIVESSEKRSSYTIGVSSGWWVIARSPELLGLGRKAMSVATYGVRYVQADIENPAEFIEPELERQIKWAKDNLGISWGVHGEIGLLISWETAIEEYWKQSHRRLHQYLDNVYEVFVKKGYEKYKPDYINFHASNMPPIGYIVERYRLAYMITVDFLGRRDFSLLFEEVPALKEWFVDNLLPIILPEHSFKEWLSRKISTPGKSVEEIARELSTILNDPLRRKEEYYNFWLEYTRERGYGGKGSILREDYAYAIVARYMYEKRDDPKEPLWKLFFGDKSFDELKVVDKEKGEVRLSPKLVAAVAARYIIGHFQTKPTEEYIEEKKRILATNDLEEFYYKSPFEKMNILKVYITFEPPEAMEGYEGMQRIIHIDDIYRLVKAMNVFSPYVKIMIDFEHLLHNGIDPEKEIPLLPDDVGKFILGCHVGAPKPLHPAHAPIDVGSEAQRIIYKWLYMLRKKGFTQGLIIFERGGRPGAPPGEFLRTTVTALRLIVEFLEKDTDPKKLPPEFYGVSTSGFLSPERQLAVIREHAYDPLKGLIMVPEEEHGFFGRAAVTKGKAEEWKRGRYR